MRNIRRKNEQVYWSPVGKAYNLTRVSSAGQLSGLSNLSQGMDLRFKPFVVSGVRDRKTSPSLTQTSFLRDAGLDLRYGITPGLNLDVTYNTDFAQVEVDEQQVNLTRFGLFFPEKREFFLENASLFTMGTGRSFSSTPVMTDLFFSRRIGLSSTGQPVPIIGGARIAGKAGAHNIGFLDIQTDSAFGKPGDNFLVGRYSLDVLSRSRIGALFINKESAGGSAHYNRTMGVDANLALGARPIHADCVVRRQDADAGPAGAGYVVVRSDHVSRSLMESLAELPGRAGQLQPRGRVRAAPGHPRDEGVLQPDTAARPGENPADGADVRADLHHRPAEPDDRPHASLHGRDAVR
jgi:hypothetical protein